MWSAYLFQTTTGQIGPRLQFESMDWSIDLNDIEDINMRLRKSDLPTVNLQRWLSPWWAGVVLLWDRTPVVAGPIISRPYENSDFISLSCGGIRSVLAKRFVTQEFSDWDQLPKVGHLGWKNLSLGTIAKRVVEASQNKQGGKLPISYALPDIAGIHERNYEGFNVANLSADDVLTKLSNVAGGPDIMFKPRLLQDSVLTFDLWTGTDTQPRIYQKQTPVWDATPVRGSISGLNFITTGSYQTDRVYAVGTGQDQGTVIKVATDYTMVNLQYPLLESHISYSDSEDPQVVLGHAQSNLKANNGPLTEVQMSVRGDGEIPFGQFWPGDLVQVVTKGWLAIPDGTTQMRLLSMSGDSSNNVKVSLQREDRYT
jgi:hypothetical protein